MGGLGGNKWIALARSEYDTLSCLGPLQKRQRKDFYENNYVESEGPDGSKLMDQSFDFSNGQEGKFLAQTNLNSERPVKNAIAIMGEIMLCNQFPEKIDQTLKYYASKFILVIS